MNYIAGLSSLSARRFFMANLIGRLPGVVLMTALALMGKLMGGCPAAGMVAPVDDAGRIPGFLPLFLGVRIDGQKVTN